MHDPYLRRIGTRFRSSSVQFDFVFSSTHYHQLAIELIQKRAQGVENAVYNNLGGTTAEYKAKIRSLFVNLKDKNNPALRESIVSGELSVEIFSKMTSAVCFNISSARSKFHPSFGIRTWHRKKGKLLIRRSKRRTSINLWPPKNNRQRPMLSNVQGANKYAPFECFLPHY